MKKIYLIGLGLNEKGISMEALEILDKCQDIYLEDYTVNFPYDILKLKSIIKKEITEIGREEVESDFLIKEASKKTIALLVYGSPLFATTHSSLIEEAKKQKIDVKVIFNSSIFDGISTTGLQLYKFGKITSMPKWQKNYNPDSFLEIIKENQKIKAHSLVLIDIGMGFKESLSQLQQGLKNKKIKIKNIVACSRIGTKNQKIIYGSLERLEKVNINLPFCLIIPSELHFFEKQQIERYFID